MMLGVSEYVEGLRMLMPSMVLAEGEGDRAAIVGWIVLAVVVAAGLFLAIAASVMAGENLMDLIASRVPKYSPLWFGSLIGGLGLLAVGFILGIFGIGLVGVILLFVVWRIADRE